MSPDPFDDAEWAVTMSIGRRRKTIFGSGYEKVVEVKKWPLTKEEAKKLMDLIPEKLKTKEPSSA